jgi:hypothetical protein
LLFLAHGENWEVAATRAIGDLVRKVLKEQDNSKDEARASGTFELLYTPPDRKQTSFKIPLPHPQKTPDNNQQSTDETFNI